MQTPIEIGLISEEAVEVLAGLNVDDEVVVGEAARNLGSGMRVRAKKSGKHAGSQAMPSDVVDDHASENNGS